MKRRIFAAVALATLVGVAGAPAQAAVSAVGWWTRNPTASAPEGGMQVANGLDGPISFGAVRAVEDADDIETAVLTLQESGQAVNGAGASLQACPALGTWTAGKGTMADAPKADCKVAMVPLTRNAAGQWTADVKSVLIGSAPALAVVPTGSAVFQVSFNPPTLDVKLRQSSSSGSSSSSNVDTSEFSAPATTSPSSGSSGSSGSGSSGSNSTFEPSSGSFSSPSGSSSSGGSFTSSFDAAPPPPQEEVAAADGSGTAETVAEDTSSGSSFVARQAASGPIESSGNPWTKFALFLAVAATIGTIAGFGRNRLTAKSA